MELMGNDDLLSEEAMEGMWADGMEQAKCPNARITYDDFLLLMKGQSTDAPPLDSLENSIAKLQGSKLLAVPEGELGFKSEDEDASEDEQGIVLPSGDLVNPDGTIVPAAKPTTIPIPAIPQIRRSLTPRTASPILILNSAPTSPAKAMAGDEDVDSPLSMDDDNDIPSNSLRNLTPPQTPTRGAQDYCTPLSGRRSIDFRMENFDSIVVPGLPAQVPTLYVRRRARSVDETDAKKGEEGGEEKEAVFNQDSRRAMTLPEHNHSQRDIEAIVRDESKSALVVNRKLYRAHRQMRLAVLEASKRFEEQQAQHAREVLMAQNEEAEGAAAGAGVPYHAGLVMKHGRKEHVSSEAIKKMLQDDQIEQRALVEKATRRGGRGRRTRKKTISDMSGMLSSMGADDLTTIAIEAASPPGATPSSAEFSTNDNLLAAGSDRSSLARPAPIPESVPEEDFVNHQLREPTVPGNFKKTTDPFGADGQYGHLKRASYKL